MLPLAFADFAALHGLKCPVQLRIRNFFEESARSVLIDARLRLPDLNSLFDRYLHTGGFPLAVTDEATTSTVQSTTFEMFWDVVSGEIGRRGRDPVRAYRLLEQIVRSLGSRISWTSLAQAMDVGRSTAEDYLRMLARMFAIIIVHKYQLEKGGPHIGAEKKVYFVDPVLAYLPHRIRQSGALPGPPALVENTVIVSLFRSEERPLAEQFLLPQALFYWRSRSGGEVDALAGEGTIKDRVPVEVKYTRRFDRRDLAAMRRSFGRGMLVTADVFDLDDPDFPVLPAPLLLWLLGGEI